MCGKRIIVIGSHIHICPALAHTCTIWTRPETGWKWEQRNTSTHPFTHTHTQFYLKVIKNLLSVYCFTFTLFYAFDSLSRSRCLPSTKLKSIFPSNGRRKKVHFQRNISESCIRTWGGLARYEALATFLTRTVFTFVCVRVWNVHWTIEWCKMLEMQKWT